MSSTVRPDLEFSDEFGARMDSLAAICDGLVAACSEVARGSADHLEPNSALASDAAVFRASFPDAARNLEFAPVQAAASYVDSIRLQLASIAALLRAREVTGSLWPIVRAELETAGRVAWLLDPRVGQPAGEIRVARYYLEVVSSVQRARFTASKYDPKAVKELKALRDSTIRDAKSLFPDLDMDLGSPALSGWSLHGEMLLALGAGAGLFADLCLSGPSKALYDILSDYAHPSLLSIEYQTRLVDNGDVSSRPWVVTTEAVEHQCRWACLILYKACHLVASYMDLKMTPLEVWADSVPASWFDTDQDP